MTLTRLPTVLLACLLLGACSGGSGDSDTPPDAPIAAPEGGPGTYWGITETGAQITLEVPVDAADPRLAEIEKYRKLAGAPAFTYIVATYDNTKGTTDAWDNGGAALITDDGQTVLMRHIAMDDGVMQTYITLDHHGLPKAVEDAAWAYQDGFYDRQKVRAGAKETVILATDESVPSIASVSAMLDDWGDEEITLTKGSRVS